MCVGFSWHAFLRASPVWSCEPTAQEIYACAKRLDEWPGDDYDGTSVRGGAKALTEIHPRLSEFRWANSIEDMLDWLGFYGTIVVGTEWTQGMMAPASDGVLKVTGPSVGGHAYLISGYSERRKALRVANSWGRSWGDAGRAWLLFEDAEKLIFRDHGEACVALEKKE
jgi:hypothetical protein